MQPDVYNLRTIKNLEYFCLLSTTPYSESTVSYGLRPEIL